MNHLHRIVLRGLPGPFFGWLGLLLFLLLMQFLMNHLPDLAGRDLPLGLVLELIAFNLAYMFVLAVPMAVLLATLVAFARLAQSQAYVVIKTSGIATLTIIWPALVAGGVVTLGMVYFNSVLLPESNFRARNIWEDIHTKRPGFDLTPGVFYDGLDNYAILVRHRTGNTLQDILIYDHTIGRGSGTTIKARTGTLTSAGTVAILDLEQGEVHRFVVNRNVNTKERYERSRFEHLRLRLDLSAFDFERTSLTDGPRTDRSTRTSVMVRMVDSLSALVDVTRAELLATAPAAPASPGAADIGGESTMEVTAFAAESARVTSARIGRLASSQARQERWLGRYRVEIHKKYSIATACLIFVLLGAPLGLSIGRRGLGTSAAIALGVFMVYWSTLVQGEKLADRGLINASLSMWIANAIVGAIAVGLFAWVALDLRVTWRGSRRLLGRRS